MCSGNLLTENPSSIGRPLCCDILESSKLVETPEDLSRSPEFAGGGILIDGWAPTSTCVHSKISTGASELLVTLWSVPDIVLARALPEKKEDRSLVS
jgi:hypothetical protein